MAATLVQSLRDFDHSSWDNEDQRVELLSAARALISKIETPFEKIMDISHSQPMLAMALKVAKDVQLFEKWMEAGGGAKSIDELSDLVGVKATLLRRLFMHLVATNVVDQVDDKSFVPSVFAKSVIEPTLFCWVDYMYEFTLPTMAAAPSFLKKNDYQEPRDSKNGIWQHAYDSPGRTIFDHCRENPDVGHMFNTCMTGWGGFRPGWLDFFPSETLLVEGNDPVLVDVGGNVGHDLELFNKKHPGYASRLVIEDLPEVVARAKCDDAITRVAHDFFTPQPIKGARAYYLKTILHDWSDQHATEILRNLKPGLKAGFSRVLINDVVIPTREPDWKATGEDLAVMCIVGSVERTADQWVKVVEDAGLRLVKIWTAPKALEGIIEAELPA
ncbi:hypothetical protein KVT40_001078 [Elsinoe batatas]|uniref:O-methyltransferase C-terminal domain-containing protein n=1 Tax=Elsinoe batatas TaxID=2601811 RepID=A0A8K0LC68_9PEZI|nr:hypothetical protein KVT40_001078 [Elsinoe batatas]